MDHAGTANGRIILDSKQEAGHENRETEPGNIGDPTASLPELVTTSSLILYQKTRTAPLFAPSLDSVELLSRASQKDWMENI